MRLIAVVALPALAAALAYRPRAAGRRAAWLVGAATAHAALVLSLWVWPAPPALGGWLAADALGLLVLSLVSALFLASATYAVGYLRHTSARGGRAFAACLLAFVAAMSLVTLSQHLALLWVGIEATTLAVAPLIYHRHDRRSLEAVWKYLLVSSVGIALALLGVFFLATAQGDAPGRALLLPDLLAHARALHAPWLRGAFIFLVVGFGTKMGIAPMHTWKPDTYGEAPGLVSALMAGALTSCAFLGVARITEVALAAGLDAFVRPLLLGFGMLSLAVAATFILGQRDVKRALAYSSVEHMGLLVLGVGLGGAGAYGSVLHTLNNGLAKTLLFLVTGNVVLLSGTSAVAGNRGVLRALPVSGALLVAGLFAILGMPPFGLFFSEFTIIGAAVAGGHPWIAAAALLLLILIFAGLAALIIAVAFGAPPADLAPARESAWLLGGPLALAGAVLLMGLWIPAPVRDALARAALALGGRAP